MPCALIHDVGQMSTQPQVLERNMLVDHVDPTGLVALRKFVAAGKGYIGTCGGSFLGLPHVGFYLPPQHAPARDGT